MTPQEFLSTLWRDKPEDMYLLIWTARDKRSHWFRDVAAAGEFVASDACRETCVYVGLGLSATDNGPYQRCVSGKIAGLCGVWSDLDVVSEAHVNKSLPPTVAAALSILPKFMPPTVTVATGNGAQAWWLFKEPLIFENEGERQDATRIVNRWHHMIRLTCAARGWEYDRLADFARVARVAGTRNMKDPANPKDVCIISSDDCRRYNLSEFDEFMDDAAIPDAEDEEKAAREWRERFKDTALTINQAARIPQSLLQQWIELDPRFEKTWNRHRSDLTDQSQSGYDMALANFGVEAGLPAQQIVDLIVHHRSLHGRKQRTVLSYFQRTIAKAMGQAAGQPKVEAGAKAPAQDSPSESANRPAPKEKEPDKEKEAAPPVDPEIARARLCEQISEEMSLGAARPLPNRILRLVRITGKNPSFRMELAGNIKIPFESTGSFTDQATVREALAGQTKWLLPRMRSPRWDKIAQKMLDACFDEDGPIESQFEDGVRSTLANYLETSGFIEDIASVQSDYRTRPTIIDGRIAISAPDLRTWLLKTMGERQSNQGLASSLRAICAESRRVAGKHYDQSRWLLPLEHFNPAKYQKASNPPEADDGNK